MTGAAKKLKAGARLAGDAADDPDGQTFQFQNRTLLNVRLDVGEDLLSGINSLRQSIWIAAKRAESLGDRDSIRIGFFQQFGR